MKMCPNSKVINIVYYEFPCALIFSTKQSTF
jgi:hypothetical protein